MKRLLDLSVSLLGLLIFSPLLLVVMFLVWNQDKKSPFYIASRVGKNKKNFNMVKLRSMIKNADKTGVDSTGLDDNRITPIGSFIRKYKLDELTQLWNVLIGNMSLVGPRPNVKNDTNLYTEVEKELLSVRPGITDFSSIVFSDEGEILNNKADPDISYNQLIRPWKSRLGLIYIKNQTFILDIKLIFFTLIAIFSKDFALKWLSNYLVYLGVDERVVLISQRQLDLYPFPPPGSEEIITSR